MQGVTEFRKILPVLKKVCNSFGNKMNTEFAQVMFLLMMQQPWFQYINVKDGFSNGIEMSSKKDLNKILSMAAYSIGAYTDNPDQLSKQLRIDRNDIVYFNTTATVGKPACFLAINHKSKEIIASIRGTITDIEVLRDLIIEPSSLQGGMVHSGMRDQANEVIVLLKPQIDNLLIRYPDYRVVFTGHSLGAGAASIATLILQTSYPSVCAYCFACPSCVSPSLLPRLQNNVISVLNMHDLVPRMNSSSMHRMKDAFEKVNWKELIDRMISDLEKAQSDSQIGDLLRFTDRLISSFHLEKVWKPISDKPEVPPELPLPSRSNDSPFLYESSRKQSPNTIIKNKQRQMQHCGEEKSASKQKIHSKHTRGQTSMDNRKMRNHMKLSFVVEPEVVPKEPSKSALFLQRYNKKNHSISSLYHSSKAYMSYYEHQKKLLTDYSNLTRVLINAYLDNVKQQLDMDIEMKLKELKSTDTPSTELSTHLVDYMDKQSQLLTAHMQKNCNDLQVSLQANHSQFTHQLAAVNKPILPVFSDSEIQWIDSTLGSFSKDSSIKSLYDSIRQLFTEGFKKREEVDWFPYPQLYPPGKLYHIQNNPMNGIMNDYDLIAEVATRLSDNKGAGLIKEKERRDDVRMVEVGKEEFDHYSLHETLFEDHRVGNYVWGLCRLYDRLHEQNCFVCFKRIIE